MIKLLHIYSCVGENDELDLYSIHLWQLLVNLHVLFWTALYNLCLYRTWVNYHWNCNSVV